MTEEEIEKQATNYAIQNYGSDDVVQSNLLQSIAKDSFQDGAKWGMEHAIQWHNLKENPNDLPKKEYQYDTWSGVIRVKDICGGYFELQYCFEDKTWHKAYDTVFEFPSKYIVAWVYSPTYKE